MNGKKMKKMVSVILLFAQLNSVISQFFFREKVTWIIVHIFNYALRLVVETNC
jgi:hypothetical protein